MSSEYLIRAYFQLLRQEECFLVQSLLGNQKEQDFEIAEVNVLGKAQDSEEWEVCHILLQL